MTTKITTTPSPLEVVDKINAVIDDTTNLSTTVGNKLDKTGKAADAVKADTATTISTTLPLDKGGTNATTAANARTNLGLATAFTAASISGKVITLTKADGTTTTLTTQDTAPFTGSATSAGGASATKPAVVVTTYRSGANWYRIWSDGTLEQGGKVARNGTITLLKAFANTDYAPLLQCFQSGASEDYTGNINGVTTTSFTYLCAGSVSHFSWYAIGKNG